MGKQSFGNMSKEMLSVYEQKVESQQAHFVHMFMLRWILPPLC